MEGGKTSNSCGSQSSRVADIQQIVKLLKVDGIWNKQQEHKNITT